MHINEIQFPIETVWEDHLSEPVVMRASALPIVSIGKPVWWNDQKVMGDKWIHPSGKARYGLARFSFSLRPDERQEVRASELLVHLHADGTGPNPIVFDIFPRILTEEQTGELSIGVGPEFKFAGAEASIAKAETKINLKQSVPVVVANGVGESVARWRFESRSTYPLIGSQIVFVVVELLSNVLKFRVNLQLSADIMDKRLGLLRGLLSDQQREQLNFVLG